MFPPARILYPQLRRIVLRTKLCGSTNGKYISTTWKKIFYRLKYVFALAEIMYPRLGKIALRAKLCASTDGKYVFSIAKK